MSKLAPTLQAFFTDRLTRERHASPHTIAAYRDTMRLLLAFAEQRTGKPPSRLGDEEIDKVSTHRQRLELDLGSRTYSTDYRRLAAPNRIRQADRDTGLLVYGNLPPAWIGLRPWYRDRGLRARVSATPARVSPRAPVAAEDVA